MISKVDVPTIRLGTDPEITFCNKDGLVRADKFFPRQNAHDGSNPDMSGDGHPQIAEIRPKPHESPAQLVREIGDIMRKYTPKLPPDVGWLAGSWIEGKPIGGHIHLSGVTKSQRLLDALNGIVAQKVLLLEDTEGARRRRASQYGKLGDTRDKSWGFEYRTLPSFILSPPIALGIFSLAKAVAYEEEICGPFSLSRLRGKIVERVAKIDAIQFTNANKTYFQERMDEIWSRVIVNYRYFHTEEGRNLWKNVALLRHIARNHSDWHNGKDLLHRWAIRRFTPEGAYTVRKFFPVLLPKEKIGKKLTCAEMYEYLFANVRRINEGPI